MKEFFDKLYENKIAIECKTPLEIETLFNLAKENNVKMLQDMFNYKIAYVVLKTKQEMYRINFDRIVQNINGKQTFYNKIISFDEFIYNKF